MKFSEKRASERIKSTLVLARNHAVEKGLLGGRLIVGKSLEGSIGLQPLVSLRQVLRVERLF